MKEVSYETEQHLIKNDRKIVQVRVDLYRRTVVEETKAFADGKGTYTNTTESSEFVASHTFNVEEFFLQPKEPVPEVPEALFLTGQHVRYTGSDVGHLNGLTGAVLVAKPRSDGRIRVGFTGYGEYLLPQTELEQA